MRWCSRVSGCVQPGHAKVSGRSDRCSCRCSVWLRPAVRASGRLSRPKGAVRCHEPGGGGSTRTQRKTPEHAENCSITCARSSRTALVTACLAPPRARCVWFPDRDRARSFAAQVMGHSRAPPHNLDDLHGLRLKRLKVGVLDLRGLGEDERRAPLWRAPAGIESPCTWIAIPLLLC